MSSLILRKANNEDIDLLFNWANDDTVRNNSFNAEKILYTTHEKWFRELLTDSSQVQYILIDDNVPIGQIRFTIKDDTAEIDYSIDKSCRGKGFGKKMLELAIKEFSSTFPKIKTIIGKVKPGNTSSRKCFLSSGFVEECTCFKYVGKV